MENMIDLLKNRAIAQVEFNKDTISLQGNYPQDLVKQLQKELLHKLALEVVKKNPEIKTSDGYTPYTSKMTAELYVFTKEELLELIDKLKRHE